MKKKLIWHIFPLILFAMLASIVGAATYMTHELHDFYLEQLKDGLVARSSLLLSSAEDAIDGKIKGNACIELSKLARARLTFIKSDGSVLCDSENSASSMDNHATRPEVALALKGTTESSIRLSSTLSQKMMYVANPIIKNGNVIGAIRIAVPITLVESALAAIKEKIFFGAVVCVLISAALAFFITRKISLPLESLKIGALEVSRGKFNEKLQLTGAKEIFELAESMNSMSEQLHKLETIRRDFVANVSHELKTPITSIKGFVETLIDGAKDDPKELDRFLDIIAKQADRLNAIIEDLLSLSRIEQESDSGEIVLETGLVSEMLKSAVQSCRHKAKKKNISVSIECGPEIKVKMNPLLLEHAISNLIDNAVKYSAEDKHIFVRAQELENEIIISVKDSGIGIPAEHLPRLFERFYRVEKARSRNMGGTGLGLAIVKHIVNAHAGKVSVESVLGEGSKFMIHLPKIQ